MTLPLLEAQRLEVMELLTSVINAQQILENDMLKAVEAGCYHEQMFSGSSEVLRSMKWMLALLIETLDKLIGLGIDSRDGIDMRGIKEDVARCIEDVREGSRIVLDKQVD